MDLSRALQHTHSLPDHQSLLAKVLKHFAADARIDGAFVSGSTATGGMDEQSDLDLGFLVESAPSREEIWRTRHDWTIAPWLHRFDADHIKPYFVIYFFEPSIHVDLNFYTPTDLPTAAGAPFVLAWDRSRDHKLETWAAQVNQPKSFEVGWESAVHEDERFWAWIHYCSSHVLRGELYDAASFVKDLRAIVEDWEARLQGFPRFDSRRVESRLSGAFLTDMAQTFCKPIRGEIKTAFQALISHQLRQRQEIQTRAPASVRWKTSATFIRKMTELVGTL